MSNFTFAPLAILELLAFNGPKIKGHVTVTTPTFREFFSGVMSALYCMMGSCVPNFEFVFLVILQLLALYAQKIKGHVTVNTHPFAIFFQG